MVRASGSKVPYLKRNNGCWAYQRRVPKDCIQLVGFEWIRLQSPSPHDRRASKKWATQLTAHWDNEFDKAKATLANQGRLRQQLEAAAAIPALPAIALPFLEALGPLEALQDAKRAVMLPAGLITPEALAQRLQVLSGYERLIKQTQALLERDVIEATGGTTADDPVLSEVAKSMRDGIEADKRAINAAATGSNAKPLAEAVESAIALWEVTNGPKPRSVEECHRAMKYFQDSLAGEPVSLENVTKDQARAFIAHLNSLKKSDGSQLALATREKYRNFVFGIFKTLEDAGKIEVNPFYRIGFSRALKKKDAGGKRETFSRDQLLLLYKTALEFIGTTEPDNQARGWVLLLGITTGARLGELTKLESSRVLQRDDVWCAHIEDGKTASSTRYLPIPQAALDAGFLRYHQTNKERPFLFNYASYDKSDIEGLVKAMSKWFARLLTDLGIKTSRGLVFHSLRHTMKDALRLAKIDKELRDRVQGHTVSDEAGKYGAGDALAALKDALDTAYATYTAKPVAPPAQMPDGQKPAGAWEQSV